MQFRTYEICRSNEGWQPIEVPSSSSDTVYVVLVNPWGNPRENICACEGYNYRGQCSHQEKAQAKLCGWDSRRSPLKPETPGICPKCDGPTKTEIEVK